MFDLKSLAKLKEEYQEKISKDGEAALKEALKFFFDKYPAIQSLTWTQYTPYFNDGDACVFHVNDVCVNFNDMSVARTFLKNEATWEYDYNQQKLIRPLTDEEMLENQEDHSWDAWNLKESPLKEDLGELASQICGAEDVMEIIFGDHVKVTAYKNKIEVDEYEHD